MKTYTSKSGRMTRLFRRAALRTVALVAVAGVCVGLAYGLNYLGLPGWAAALVGGLHFLLGLAQMGD